MKDKKVALAVFVLVVFHIVGFYGLAFSANPAWFRELSALNLLLTNFLLFSFHKTWNIAFAVFAVIVLLVGFFSEVIGVHTGLLFGDYAYGEGLGYKLWEIPLIIALNWLLLVYSTGILVQKLPWHWLLKAFVAATLMVLLDMLIEPVTAVLDYWTWADYRIPVSNYLGWLGVAFVLHLLFQKCRFQKQNALAPFVLGVQFLFFIGLNLVL
ncbi:MAG: carotenoid biosynthesis protein [Adhaeribacter sp.]